MLYEKHVTPNHIHAGRTLSFAGTACFLARPAQGYLRSVCYIAPLHDEREAEYKAGPRLRQHGAVAVRSSKLACDALARPNWPDICASWRHDHHRPSYGNCPTGRNGQTSSSRVGIEDCSRLHQTPHASRYEHDNSLALSGGQLGSSDTGQDAILGTGKEQPTLPYCHGGE